MIRVTQFMRRPRANAFSIEQLHEDLRAAMPPDCRVRVWTCRNFSNGFLPRLRDIWLARKQQEDVNHVTGDVHYLTFLLDRNRTVLTVHDLIMLGRLRGLPRFMFWFLWYWLPVRRSRAVVVISESTREQLLKSVRCDPAKVCVIHNNVSDQFQPLPAPFDASYPRILQIGTALNKNIERVAAALEGVRCRLVIIGPLSVAQTDVLKQHGIDYENHIGISRAALVGHYEAADMLVFASIYEGFGLPILEAQAVGRPVVTSNLWSMPEVAGGAACLVDPFDAASIRAGLLRIIQDSAYRQGLVRAGLENVKHFRAETVAERYAALYRKVVGHDGAWQDCSQDQTGAPCAG